MLYSMNLPRIRSILPKALNCEAVRAPWNLPPLKRGQSSASAENHSSSLNSVQRNDLISAHLLPRTFNFNDLRRNLQRLNAKYTHKDRFIHVQCCEGLNHRSGSAIFTHNGVVVLWGHANSALGAYRSLVPQTNQDSDPLSEFSETLKFTETDGDTRVSEGSVLLTISEDRKHDERAISLALDTAVRLNYLESDIKKSLELRNNSVFELDRVVKSHNLVRLPFNGAQDRAAKTLFDLETYAHDCRYRLNLQQDLLEYPDVLWDYDRQCDLFNRVQSTFEIPKRLEHLNHRFATSFEAFRISWTLETLNSYSEYVRHQHSSRLEKIIIAVISVELMLAFIQAVRSATKAKETEKV